MTKPLYQGNRSSSRSDRFPKASRFEPAHFNRADYLERTKRNHFWFGGPFGQESLRNLSIGVAGLGGMGSNIAELMVRLGVGHLRIADPDTIDVSNINRQVIANRNTVGMPKIEASTNELRSLAQDFELVCYNDGITDDNAEEFVNGCDAIVDEIDVYPLHAHVTLHRAARKAGIPIYSAYVVGLGIHFYKFHGEEYTFEKFLDTQPENWKRPSAQLIIDRFAPPYANYLDDKVMPGYQNAIASGGTPIFGPATLAGHSMVTTRLLLDMLREKHPQVLAALGDFERTPTMPEFLALDLVDLTIRKVRVGG